MMICGALSIQALGYDDFWSGNKSDLFAAVFVIFSSLILVALPLYMLYVIWYNFETLDRPETKGKYGYMYSDLSTRTIYQAIFHVIYMLRRAVFVFILVYFESYNGF